MKKVFIVVMLIVCITSTYGQDKILSIGYSKNFVNSDSSNFALQIDLNRTVGKSEAAGSFYILNENLREGLRFYLKPTADVNLGSYTTTAPNNISVGLPFGITWDIPKFSKGTFDLSLEISSDVVAEKSLQQYLYYFSPGLIPTYNLTSQKNNVVDVGAGVYFSSGTRLQNVKTKVKNAYQKFTIPVSLSLALFRNKGNTFHRIKFTGIYKFNHITKDDRTIAPDEDKIYTLLKFDFYIIKQIGINFTYNAGYEEPLFKKVNSLSFGVTFAR